MGLRSLNTCRLIGPIVLWWESLASQFLWRLIGCINLCDRLRQKRKGALLWISCCRGRKIRLTLLWSWYDIRHECPRNNSVAIKRHYRKRAPRWKDFEKGILQENFEVVILLQPLLGIWAMHSLHTCSHERSSLVSFKRSNHRRGTSDKLANWTIHWMSRFILSDPIRVLLSSW